VHSADGAPKTPREDKPSSAIVDGMRVLVSTVAFSSERLVIIAR